MAVPVHAPITRVPASSTSPVPLVVACWYALVLGYGGRLWLEISHPASGISHSKGDIVAWWLQGAMLMLPVTVATTYAVLRLVARWKGAPSSLRLPEMAVTLIALAMAVSAVTTLLLPALLWLYPDPHAHGELPPAWYEFGSGLQLLRANVVLGSAVLLVHRAA